MLYAMLIFFSAVFLAVLSAANDDGFVRLILGDRYVNMTLFNIQQNDLPKDLRVGFAIESLVEVRYTLDPQE